MEGYFVKISSIYDEVHVGIGNGNWSFYYPLFETRDGKQNMESIHSRLYLLVYQQKVYSYP